jgi:hypothetical protein
VIKNNEFPFVPNTKNVFIMIINHILEGGGGGGHFFHSLLVCGVIGGDNMA